MVDQELECLRTELVSQRELDRARNGLEVAFLASLEQLSGFGGKADMLNGYYVATSNPDYFALDLNRYRAVRASDLAAVVRSFLPADRRVELTVVPEVKK